MEPDWRWATMAPSWIRWLPCSIAHLRIVPDQHRFPRDAWEHLPEPMPWQEPVWCDPGDVADWIAQAVEQHEPGEEALAEEHAREHYEQAVQLRSQRIELFTAMCYRAGLAVPHTLHELLSCLVGMGLFHREVDGAGREWLTPRLWLNPLDLLPLTADEAAAEVRNQYEERAALAAIGLRRIAERDGANLDPADVTVRRTIVASLREIATSGTLPIGQIRGAVGVLARANEVDPTDADLTTVGLDAPVTFEVRWPDFADAFSFEELPAPEHLI